MRKIKLTQGKHALVDNEDFEYLSQFKWHACKWSGGFYAARSINNRKVYMHQIVMGSPKEKHIDHKNHFSLDNRKKNLRICTAQENMRNRKPKKVTISNFKGVYLCRQNNKWVAYIGTKHLGYFISKIEAALAYNKKAKELYGEFAYLNKISQ